MIYASDTAAKGKTTMQMPRVSELTEAARKGEAARSIAQLIYLRAKRTSAEERIAEARTFSGSGDVYRLVKAAVEAGGAQSGEWGSEMSTYNRLAREWIATVSARTLLGRLAPVRVPFATRTAVESGVTATYGHTIPVGALSLTATSALDRLGIGAIAVFTSELFRVWRPGSAENINAVLARAVARGMDAAALDPDSSAVTGERPASLLNGVSPLGLFGATAATSLASFGTLLDAMVDAESDGERVVFVMHPSTALQLSLLTNSNGDATYPNLGPWGGSVLGVQVYTTVSAQRSGSPTEKIVGCLDGARIAMADDGEVSFDVSGVAAIQMDSAPTMDATGTPTATNVTSMFQTDSIAVKAVRYANFARAHSSAVAWMTAAY